MTDANVPDQLLQDLAGPDDKVRWKAAMALGRMGARAVPALVGLLGHKDHRARIATTHALRDMKEEAAGAVPALVANLSCKSRGDGDPNDRPFEVRLTAIGALSQAGPAALDAVPALVAMLKGVEELEEADGYQFRGLAAWVLQGLGPESARRSPEVIPALAGALKDEERRVRLNAAAALGAMGPATAEAVPALLEALRHPDVLTRRYAALAFGALGEAAAPHVPALVEAHDSIALDEFAREQIRRTIHAISGRWPEQSPASAPSPSGPRWAALERTDFLLAVMPLQVQRRTSDQDELTQAFVDARLANAFCFWPDHNTWYNIPLPTPDQMARWGMVGLWYFFTEDPYNPKLQREWGYSTLTDYNRAVIDRILDMGRQLGRDRCFWSVGHEQMDSLHAWGVDPDGSRTLPEFGSKREGYEYYANWISTSRHKLHWNGIYGNWRPRKLYMGWDTGAKATWDFLEEQGIDPLSVTMMSGGVCPALAHATFDILPQVEMYWWECQIDGASLQVGSAYTRGAARQYGKRWMMDASPWSPVSGAPGCDSQGNWNKGAPPATQLRTWVYGYLCGAYVVFEESSSISHFFRAPGGELALSETGRAARETARFCFDLCPQRGESYNPVGVILEHEHGLEPRPHTNFRGSGPWGFMPMGGGEWEIEKFWTLAYPNHSTFPDRSQVAEDDKVGREPRILTGGTFGDCFDVLTDRCPEEVFSRYPRLMTLGGIGVEGELLERLKRYVRAGGELLLNAAHLGAEAIRDSMTGVTWGDWVEAQAGPGGEACVLRQAQPGSARVLEKTPDGHPLITVNDFGQGKVYLVTVRHNLTGSTIGQDSGWLPAVTAFLKGWVGQVWPVRVETGSGAPPQTLLTRLPEGWLVALGNHDGRPWEGKVRLDAPGTGSALITELWSGQQQKVAVEAGEVTFDARSPKYAFSVYRVEMGK
ncbi:MAG: HEAT repeat domain-containing protein [Candidatus Latescibacteria bacterium]|nr:HEAT repeat domain-containing protein [Candidatus Latescibacterota bacterium]